MKIRFIHFIPLFWTAFAFAGVAPTLPGLKVWIDAGAIQGAKDGQQIQHVRDLAGKHEFSAVGSAPVYAADAINGKPAIKFSGDGLLKSADVAGSSLTRPDQVTVALVAKQDEKMDSSDLFGWGDCKSNLLGMTVFFGTNYRFTVGDPNAGKFDQGFPATWIGQPTVLVLTRKGSAFAGNFDRTHMNHGTGISSSLNTKMKAPFILGDGPCGGHFNGYVAELRVYNRALDQKEMDGLSRYLMKKYDIKGQ